MTRTLAAVLTGAALAFAAPSAPASAALCRPTQCPVVRDQVCGTWVDCTPSPVMCSPLLGICV